MLLTFRPRSDHPEQATSFHYFILVHRYVDKSCESQVFTPYIMVRFYVLQFIKGFIIIIIIH